MKNCFRVRTFGIFSVFLVLLFGITTQVFAAKPSKPKLTAAQIADKNAAARGGLSTWLAVQSMTMTGKIGAGKIKPTAKETMEKKPPSRSAEDEGKEVELPFVLDMRRPRKTRLEIEFAGQTAVQVFDGANGWKLRPFLGRKEVEPFTADEMKTAGQQQDMEGLLINYSAKGIRLTLGKTEQVEGKDAYKLGLTLKDGEVKHIWIDAQTFLDVKMAGSLQLEGKPRTVTTYFRNYKVEGGLQIPHLIETSVEGIRGSEKIIIEQVTLNPKFDDKRFAKPE
jgi:outer membrane lipoprotein-sorting protein